MRDARTRRADAAPILSGARRNTHRGPTWEPPVDIVETDRELTIVVALPGVRPADIDVQIEAACWLVRGARALPSVPDGAVIHRLEIPHGRFERRVLLQAALGTDPPRGHRRLPRALLSQVGLMTPTAEPAAKTPP